MKSSSPDDRQPKRRSFGPLFLGLFLVGLLAAIVLALSLGYSSMMKGSVPQTAQQFTTSSPGAPAQIAVEVTSLSSQTVLTGYLLQKNSDDSYTRTDKTVRVKWNSAKIVMGSHSDVKVGAILQANGVIGAHGILTASQLVVLTRFAQVK